MKFTLKMLRVRDDKNQSEVSKDLGISVMTLQSWETGKTYPNVKMIKKLCEYYNIKFDDIDFLCN